MKHYEGLNRSVSLLVLIGLCSAQIPGRNKWNQVDILKDRFDLKGVVTSDDNHTLQGVTVTAFEHYKAGGYAPVKTVTDTKGGFVIQRVGHVAYFQKQGFRPEIRILPEGEHSVSVQLRAFKADATLRQCNMSQRSAFKKGTQLAVKLPEGIKSVRHSGDDTWDEVFFNPGHTKQTLLLWSGPMLGGNQSIPESLLLEATEFEHRILADETGHEIGFDLRGNSKDGRWRYLGVQYDLLEYNGIPKESANYFDSIVDSACLIEPFS